MRQVDGSIVGAEEKTGVNSLLCVFARARAHARACALEAKHDVLRSGLFPVLERFLENRSNWMK